MNEEYWAEQFSCELDGLLCNPGQVRKATAPAEYAQALSAARELAGLDFSVESSQQIALRRRLLDEAHQDASNRKEHHMKTLRLRRVLVLSIVATTLALALMLSLYPGGAVAAAENLYKTIRSIILGEYSRALQVEPWNANDPASIPSDVWIVHTEIGNFAGNAPPGVEPMVRSVTSWEDAQAVASFHLVVPTYLPKGYTSREAKLAPIGGTYWVISFYGSAAHDIVIVQMPVGPQPSNNPDASVSIGTMLGTEDTLEDVDLDGRKAAWADGHTLMWEADGSSYIVGGLDLTLDEAKRIARSLR